MSGWCDRCALKNGAGKHRPRCRCLCHKAPVCCPPGCECGVLAGIAEAAIKMADLNHQDGTEHDEDCEGCDQLDYLASKLRICNERRRG